MYYWLMPKILHLFRSSLWCLLALFAVALMPLRGDAQRAPASSEEPSIGEIREVERGASVTLRGTVDRIADEDTFILRDDSGRIPVYIGWQNALPVKKGEVITVLGRADDDAIPGILPEIYARVLIRETGERIHLRGDFSVGREASAPSHTRAKPTIGEIQAIGEVRRGAAVALRGTVHRISDEDTFILRDETGRIRVYIGWQNDLPVAKGDTVTVLGRADDDALPGIRPEIYARVLILQDGERIQLRSDNG
jgi:uncharacterized protein YdeI (BOF family)